MMVEPESSIYSSRKSNGGLGYGGGMMGKGGGGGDNGIKTVESLRGRLLAEREASKAAKAEADLMAKRLGELERKLAVEIKSKNRAEKRLDYALKKLNSLKLSNFSESSQGSSEGCKVNFMAAVDSFGQCGLQGEVEETRDGVGLENVAEDDRFGSSSGHSANQVASREGSWSSVGTAHSRNKEDPVRDEDIDHRDHEGLLADAERRSSLDTDEPDSHINDKNSDDALALVPVQSAPPSSRAHHQDINGSNVQEVLLALRQVKKQLRNSMRENTCRALVSQRVL